MDPTGVNKNNDISKCSKTGLQSREDFPPINTQISKKEQASIKEISLIKLENAKNAATAKSYPRPDHPRQDQRTKAFQTLSDKTEVRSHLSCTKGCKHVYKLPDGTYSQCTFPNCTFAHSMEQLKTPRCLFPTCRKSQCSFKHSSETKEEWLKRTRIILPDLPPTASPAKTTVTAKHAAPTPPSPAKTTVTAKHATPAPTPTPSPTAISTPSSTGTFNFNNYLETSDSRSRSRRRSSKRSSRRYRNFSSDSNSDSDSPPRRSRRHSSSSKLEDEKDTVNTRVIRVPTEALAEIALQAAFDRNQYNVKVIIEK